jgi:hypothetical protein
VRLGQQYKTLKRLAANNQHADPVAALIADMANYARGLIGGHDLGDLNSRVGKNYFGFRGEAESRPVNVDLCVHDEERFGGLLESFLVGRTDASPEDITQTAYTLALCIRS